MNDIPYVYNANNKDAEQPGQPDQHLYCLLFLYTQGVDVKLIQGYLMRLHGVQRRMISVDYFFVFLRLLFFALLLLYVI